MSRSLSVSLIDTDWHFPNLVDYFGGCPSLHIPGFTHPVQDRYVDLVGRALMVGT